LELSVPAQFAPLLLSRALSRQLFVYAAASIVLAQVALIAMGIDASQPWVSWATGLLIVPGVLLAGLMFLPPNFWLAAMYLLAGGVALCVIATLTLTLVPNAPTTALAPFALVSLAMILVSGASVGTFGRVLWALVGFSVSMVALLLAASFSGAEFHLDARAIIGTLVVMGIAFIVPGQVSLAAKAQSAFDASLKEIEADVERTEISREAIARLHDTLLADLTVLTKIRPGPLSNEVRATIEAELAHLVSTDWLVNVIEKSESDQRSREQTSSASDLFLAALDDSTAGGLAVNVSGDLSALNPLSLASATALSGAVSQCLSNVIHHAGILSVDVVVLGTGDGVTVTVIDGGVGFDPDAVESNRLGIRVSVRARIEAVGGFAKVWSVPGQGTAIMLQLPYQGAF
jgi:signal transduction histidine kinase